MKSILVVWSGGLDSTYVLYKYLTETDYPVMAHHILLQNRNEFRWHQEQRAVENIKDWLKHSCRNFRYTESSYYNSLSGKDITLCLFIASQVAHGLVGADTKEIIVATGRIMEDDERTPIHTQDDVFWAGVKDIEIPVSLERPIRTMTKRDIIEECPKELVDLTWSCRQPEFINGAAIPCGTCHACIERGAS
jgi:7-cyano-7-deazaguanine synthase in queuosine biosynthesis